MGRGTLSANDTHRYNVGKYSIANKLCITDTRNKNAVACGSQRGFTFFGVRDKPELAQ